jgi:hypothetical protein
MFDLAAQHLAVAGHFGAGNAATLVGIVIAVIWYFVPTIIAWRFDRKHKGWITVLNLLLGVTIVGWIAAFVWSLAEPREA